MSFYKEVPGRQTTLESTLKFDTAPTAGSTNPVTSGGVATAIDRVVPQNSYTALAGNTALPLKVDSNGKLTNNGVSLTATGNNAWAEGNGTAATGNNSHAEGATTQANAANTHAEGGSTKANAVNSHAEGARSVAGGFASHAEGTDTTTSASCAHAEGEGTTASGANSHSEGYQTKASSSTAHAEGRLTIASGDNSHVGGSGSKAEGYDSFAHGTNCEAKKTRSFAGGNGTISNGASSFAYGKGVSTSKDVNAWFGQFNADEDAFFGIGNGTADNARKNAFKIDKNGHMWANADEAFVDVTASLDTTEVGSQITQTPPQAEYTVGNYYFVAGNLCKCSAYSESSATFDISSLLDALNSLNT